MKRLVVGFVLFILIVPCVYAGEKWLPDQVEYQGKVFTRDTYWKKYEQVEYADIDGDNIDEIITRFRVEEEMSIPAAVTAIYKIQDGEKILAKVMFGGETPTAMDLFDVDNDGVKDLIVYDHCGNHYTLILIYSYKDGDYVRLFENGTPCYLYDVITDTKPVQVVIGRENWNDKEFCYANSGERSLKEVYAWNGKEFEYSSKLSTTPFIGEKQALEVTWQSYSDGTGNDPDTEYMVKGWNAGSRSFELFQEELDEIRQKQIVEKGTVRLGEINEQLQGKVVSLIRAELLAEKAWIVLTIYDDVNALKTATNCLLEALQIAPNNEEYKQYIIEIYDDIWSKITFKEKDITKELEDIKARTTLVVNACRIGR